MSRVSNSVKSNSHLDYKNLEAGRGRRNYSGTVSGKYSMTYGKLGDFHCLRFTAYSKHNS